ncbi:2-hydroxyacid dehydrogenase [Paenibacillus humicola]|uniref:2-hydroxyacid dehydrogenase n=1 Tax=Paenibacillus humicola TaxID=3110540 RepID=UPI00237A1BDE|nr:2-hydroxyacid dehydrogenase [Paenibacillus humicola]
MIRQAVVITAKGRESFTPAQTARLERAGRVEYVRALDPIPPDRLASLLENADVAGLTPRSVPSIDEGWIRRLPRLKGIAVFATGVDYIDTELLRERGIALRNLPDYSTVSVAEHTIGLLLTLSRRIHLSQDRVRGRVPAGTSVRGWELCGKTIGLVGLGRIGGTVAKLASAFGMRVIGFDPRQRNEEGVAAVDMEELLASSDIVSLHYPSSWSGAQTFGAPQLERMKRGAYLINVSRAALVDDRAIIDAIDAGRLYGYALDDRFSLADDSRARKQIEEGRILQTGHTAWYSNEVIERGHDAWVDNIADLLRGLVQAEPEAGKGSATR